MTTEIFIRLDAETRSRLMKLAEAEGKNASQVVRELIEAYIQKRESSAYVDDLWARIGNKLRARRVGNRDIQRAIRAARAAKK